MKKFWSLTLILFAVLLSLAPPMYAGTTAFDLVISAGTPQIGSGDYTTTGSVLFVDSGHASRCNAADCGTYDKPFSTVDYAIGRTTANNGDIIFVAPGHAESYTAANGFDADVAGIRIVGLGEGNDRPSFTFADTDATIAIGAANVTIENLRFIAGISDIVVGISVEAAGKQFTMKNCEFPVPGTATFEFLSAIQLATAANNATFIGNTYRDGASSAANYWLDVTPGIVTGLRVIGNDIFGRFAVAAVGSNKAITGALIENNKIANTVTGQFAVEFTAAATGQIVNNRLFADAAATTLDPGSMYCTGNIMVNAIDSGGVTVPVAAAGGGSEAVATVDGTANTYSRDVIGNKEDAAAVVGTTKSIMANVKQVTNQGQKIDGAALSGTPTANSLATFIATGGTALGTQLGASKSIIDALGANGVAKLTIGAGSILGAAGQPFIVKKALTSSGVVQAGIDVTAAATGGDIIIDDIIIQTDGTGLAAGTNFTLEKDAGATGVLTFFGETVANLGANKTEALGLGSVVSSAGGMVLDSGRKIVAKCTVADCTGAGVLTVWIKARRGADGANLAAAP